MLPKKSDCSKLAEYNEAGGRKFARVPAVTIKLA